MSDFAAVVARFTGNPEVGFTKLPQDASNRSYHRFIMEGIGPVMIMKLADEPFHSDEITGGAVPTRLPFLDVAKYLEGGNIGVPKIFHEDIGAGVVILEDLGDETIERALAAGKEKIPLYCRAVKLLVQMQAWAHFNPEPDCIAFQRRFSAKLLRWELQHFYEWCLVEWTAQTPTPSEEGILNDFFDDVTHRLTHLEQGFVHRDYQSRNIMIKNDLLRLIDFQDALIGPWHYDVVALLRDSYVQFDSTEAKIIQGAFLEERKNAGLPAPGEEDFTRQFQLQAMQRKLKDAGRFVFIDRVKKNPKFLPNIPQSLRYAQEALSHFPEYNDARTVLGRYLPEFFGDDT